MNSTSISVIIPAFKEQKNLGKLIPYLVDISSGYKVEIIVAFSDKDRDAYSCLPQSPGLRLLQCNQKGRAVQLNHGAAVARGDVLAFLHADVWPPKTFFDKITATIQDGMEAGMFSYRFDREDFFLKINSSFTGKDGIFTGGGDQCLFITKSAFDELGGYKESQVIMEDFELFQRIKQSGIAYRIVQEDLIVSSRKYDHNSYLRVNLSNLLLVILFKLNYPAGKLKSLHNRLIRVPHLEDH